MKAEREFRSAERRTEPSSKAVSHPDRRGRRAGGTTGHEPGGSDQNGAKRTELAEWNDTADYSESDRSDRNAMERILQSATVPPAGDEPGRGDRNEAEGFEAESNGGDSGQGVI
jgi:hypothetical protein